jgi:hypothetical protein
MKERKEITSNTFISILEIENEESGIKAIFEKYINKNFLRLDKFRSFQLYIRAYHVPSKVNKNKNMLRNIVMKLHNIRENKTFKVQ